MESGGGRDSNDVRQGREALSLCIVVFRTLHIADDVCRHQCVEGAVFGKIGGECDWCSGCPLGIDLCRPCNHERCHTACSNGALIKQSVHRCSRRDGDGVVDKCLFVNKRYVSTCVSKCASTSKR